MHSQAPDVRLNRQPLFAGEQGTPWDVPAKDLLHLPEKIQAFGPSGFQAGRVEEPEKI